MNKDDDNPELSDTDFARAKPFHEAIRNSGRGYNARVEKVLREAIDKGRL